MSDAFTKHVHIWPAYMGAAACRRRAHAHVAAHSWRVVLRGCRSVEMFFASLLHRAAFSHLDYREDDTGVAASERMSLISNVMDSLNPNDVMSDVKGVVSTQKAKVGLDHLLMSSWAARQREEGQ